MEHQKEKRARGIIEVDVDSVSVNFPLGTSLWKNPKAFALVFPQLVLEEDQPVYEKVGMIGVLECTTQMALQVSSCIYVSGFKILLRV